MSDDEIIQQRIAGKSMRAIAKAKGIALTDVNRALDLFTETMFNDKVRKRTLALELARFDEPQEVFYRQAKAGDLQSAPIGHQDQKCSTTRPRAGGPENSG